MQLAKISDPTAVPSHKQSQWDGPLLQEVLSSVSGALQDPYDQARLRAVQFPHASDWLHALPLTAYDLRLSDEAVRVAAGLRLGLAICEPHTCACGAPVSSRGSHGLACHLGLDVRLDTTPSTISSASTGPAPRGEGAVWPHQIGREET